MPLRHAHRTILTVVVLMALTAGTALAQAPAPSIPLFPKDSTIAFVDFTRVASDSVPGKALLARLKSFRDGKLFELTEKQKQIDGLQTRFDGSPSVLSESARAQLVKDIERLKRELQFGSQDAQAQLDQMEQEGFADLRKRIDPILKDLATERHLDAIFSLAETAAPYVDPRIDLSAEVTKRLDAAANKK